jgi:Fe-S-cluster-containing dehydrogenase component/formate-dependent nitrite reductase membrane component NrfD
VQLGFVIDHSKCIGCHACTVACKSENQVPVGSFRTWVKYTEAGEFPAVKRSFAVLRCNQCTAAPCVTICPTGALEKRLDGIVDVNPKACIGCKSCMQGCPYDALYIHPDKGTAEKCHFCAHRAEQGLAPACAIVCPTEAIIPGDFHDPESRVSRMKRELELSARKTEAGTGPNVFYREVAPAGIDPLKTSDAGGHLWATRHPGVPLEARAFDAGLAAGQVAGQPVDAGLERALEARARTTYDVPHPPLWGWKIAAYLLTKALAAGVFLAAIASGIWQLESAPPQRTLALGIPALALGFLALTSLLLVADLKRPERFYLILTRPNSKSWLVRGTYVLMAYGTLLTFALGWTWLEVEPITLSFVFSLPTVLAAALSAAYTGWLFGQAKGRVLWMQQGLWLRLVLQAVAGGAALLLLVGPLLALEEEQRIGLGGTLMVSLGLLLFYTVFEARLAPKGREEEYARTLALLKRGPYAYEHALLGLLVGMIAPLVLLVLGAELAGQIAGVLVLVGLWSEKSLLVRAGQALPIS